MQSVLSVEIVFLIVTPPNQCGPHERNKRRALKPPAACLDNRYEATPCAAYNPKAYTNVCWSLLKILSCALHTRGIVAAQPYSIRPFASNYLCLRQSSILAIFSTIFASKIHHQWTPENYAAIRNRRLFSALPYIRKDPMTVPLRTGMCTDLQTVHDSAEPLVLHPPWLPASQPVAKAAESVWQIISERDSVSAVYEMNNQNTCPRRTVWRS